MDGHEKIANKCAGEPPSKGGRPRKDGQIRHFNNGWFMLNPPDTDPLEKIVELYPNVNAVIYDRACSCMSAGQKMSSLHGIKVRAVDRFHSKGHVANCPCHTTVIPRLRKRMKGINTSIAEQSCAWFRGYAHTFNSVGPAMQRFYLLAYGRRHTSVVSCKDLRHLNQYSTEKKLRKATRSLKKPASGAYQCSPKAMRKQRSSPGSMKCPASSSTSTASARKRPAARS